MRPTHVLPRHLMGIMFAVVTLATGCGTGDTRPEKLPETVDRQAVVSWVHGNITYPVVSGIAVPGYRDPEEGKVKEAIEGEAVRVYLSDQRIDCHLHPFPFAYFRTGPPLPTETGATITLNFHKMTTLDNINANFDVRTVDSGGGVSAHGVRGSAKFVGPDNAKRVEGWLEYKLTHLEFPKVEVSGAFDVPFCPADIISFAPATDIENAAGTIQRVSGVWPYRDPGTFERVYESISDVYLYVIGPDAKESILLVPSDVPFPASVLRGASIPLLTRSDMPEEFRRDGLRVVFGGKVGEKPVQYNDLILS